MKSYLDNSVVVGDEMKDVEQLMEKYEEMVIQIAENLSGSEKRAAEICEQVFLRMLRVDLPQEELELEKFIHSITYEVAISSLMDNLDKTNQSASETISQLLEINEESQLELH